MAYYQDIVVEYLCANRRIFVKPECLIQLDHASGAQKGRHWYCDAMAVNVAEETAYLCEVSFDRTLHALTRRLRAWQGYWPELRNALKSDCGIPTTWNVEVFAFIPRAVCEKQWQTLDSLFAVASTVNPSMPRPKVTWLEEVVPWEFPSNGKSHCLERRDAVPPIALAMSDVDTKEGT